jgi:mannonate dehydratase
VRVIVAHCASMGSGVDLDRGPDGPMVENFRLFARLMETPGYEGLLFGDISAMTQLNRVAALVEVIRRPQWHSRLLNGSDYPLPGVMPLFSLDSLVQQGYLDERAAATLSAIRRHNPLLFDFVLKRHMRVDGNRLAKEIFESRRLFTEPASRTS